MYAREPASIWRENVVAVVVLLRVFARMSWWRKQDIKSFIILPSGERVTSFTKDDYANFSGEKWQNEAFRDVYTLRRREKPLAQISYS